MLKAAPDFKLLDQSNKARELTDYSGKWVVLYFYPKDNTAGCTKEACSFRDERDAIAEFGHAEVIGVSRDSVVSHKKFAEKNNLNFTLLSDPDHEVIEAYGAWGPQKFMGHEYIGIKRNTYLIDPDGNIAKEYLGVDPKTHASQIIKDLGNLQKQSTEA